MAQQLKSRIIYPSEINALICKVEYIEIFFAALLWWQKSKTKSGCLSIGIGRIILYTFNGKCSSY